MSTRTYISITVVAMLFITGMGTAQVHAQISSTCKITATISSTSYFYYGESHGEVPPRVINGTSAIAHILYASSTTSTSSRGKNTPCDGVKIDDSPAIVLIDTYSHTGTGDKTPELAAGQKIKAVIHQGYQGVGFFPKLDHQLFFDDVIVLDEGPRPHLVVEQPSKSVFVDVGKPYDIRWSSKGNGDVFTLQFLENHLYGSYDQPWNKGTPITVHGYQYRWTPTLDDVGKQIKITVTAVTSKGSTAQPMSATSRNWVAVAHFIGNGSGDLTYTVSTDNSCNASCLKTVRLSIYKKTDSGKSKHLKTVQLTGNSTRLVNFDPGTYVFTASAPHYWSASDTQSYNVNTGELRILGNINLKLRAK